jgi:response regulator RpfG family c-di-GMP phosphodiesterase
LDLLRDRDDFVLLFTDIMMPEMDGIQLIREARQIRPALIPIVMTGFATLETARAAVKEGAYDYVLKPFSLSEVKLAVSNALERYRLATENARLRELTNIFTISEAMAGIRDEKQLLEFVLKAALKQVGADRGSLMITTPDGGSLEIAVSVGLPAEAITARVGVGEGIAGRVAQSAEPLLVTEIREHPEVEALSRGLPSPGFVSVPLEAHAIDAPGNNGTKREVLAVLNVSNKRGRARFSDADLKTLNIVAKHAAAAIENVRQLRGAEESHRRALESVAALLEARDAYRNGYSTHVGQVAEAIARRAGVSDEDIETLKLGATIHDIGKIGVDPSLLRKDGSLTDAEWESLRRHTLLGFDLVKTARFLSPEAVGIVRNHHERSDGNGYPDGLKGEEIPRLVRIMSVADAYVAMTSPRPYRPPLEREEVIGELKRNRGTQFDPEYTDHLIALVESGDVN